MSEYPKSYAWPTETLPTLGFAHHLKDLLEFRDFLRQRAIKTEGTRIDRYITYLERTVTSTKIDVAQIFKNVRGSPLNSPADWLLYLLREAHELMWILKGLRVRVPSGVDEHLRAIVGGSDFAALDADSRARNKQFELRIASYFCQAGCEVDLSTDTDIISSTESEVFYIECKRISAKNQITKRLSEARKQLARRMPTAEGNRIAVGFIAMDVTKAAFLHNGLTLGLTNEHSRDVIQEKLVELTADLDPSSLFSGCPGLLNCWFQIHISSLVMHPATPMSRFSSAHLSRMDMNSKEQRAWNAFRSIFESASNDDRENAPRTLTRRLEFEIPEGTAFQFDGDILTELLVEGRARERDQSETVGSITVDGTTHEFSYLELMLIGGDRLRDWKKELGEHPGEARLGLIMRMYARRFPFDEA